MTKQVNQNFGFYNGVNFGKKKKKAQPLSEPTEKGIIKCMYYIAAGPH